MKHLGKQGYRCKLCGYQFIRLTPRGRPASEKALAVLLHLLGLSFNRIARMPKVSVPAALGCIRPFAEKTHKKPEPGEAVIVELDGMPFWVQKTNSGSGKLAVAVTADSLTGNAELVIKKHFPA
ncbi:hypothetical protein [uncultured Desulfovibrio sp.]|uniref:hypothetical protein n=1 Tax=uncultured Desulfovibrio sp. TaxID=167968 RepID=UPI00261120CC|nr:hypothetical protein [uncultured Desulfovibrio sp.]